MQIHGNILGIIILLSLFLAPIDLEASANENIDSTQTSDSTASVTSDARVLTYDKRPGRLEFLIEAPKTAWQYTIEVARKQSILKYIAILAATGVLVAVDQPILDATAKFGRRLGLSGNNKMKRAFSVFGQPIEVPHDMDTALYFIGDGWTHLLISGSYLTYGLSRSDNRAINTASQITEAMLAAGAITQILKHITGRESPFKATRDGGRWDFFPNQIEYHRNVPSYDAFPSGHLAVSMATVTVIAENYPEQKWVRPIGYTLMTLLSFEMVNNGVHWVSDYPLALAIGHSVAKIIYKRSRRTTNDNGKLSQRQYQFSASPLIDRNYSGIRIAINM